MGEPFPFSYNLNLEYTRFLIGYVGSFIMIGVLIFGIAFLFFYNFFESLREKREKESSTEH